MFNFLNNKKKKTEIYAPFSGKIIDVSEINDPIFSQMMMGDGVGILPSEQQIFAPMEGTIAVIAETKHAICIRNDKGIELMVHCGIDTVKYGGNGFKILVESGAYVHPGDLLFEFDEAFFAEKGVDMTSPILVINSSEHPVAEKALQGEVRKGDMIYVVE